MGGERKMDFLFESLLVVWKFKRTGTTTFEKPPSIWAVAGYISYVFLFVVSLMRDLLFGKGPLRGEGDVNKFRERPSRQGYAPLYASFESFYTSNVYRRLKKVFGKPI